MRAVIVGAGMSGAFAADALRRRLGPRLQLSVIEREPRTGGRASYRNVNGVDVETGASLFHSSNQLITSAAADLGLGVLRAAGSGGMAVWDGSRVLFETSGGRRDTWRILSRYRSPMLRAGREVQRLVRRLESVYPRLEAGHSWASPDHLFRDLDLYEMSQQNARTRLRPGRFLTEFVDGVSRNNYAQESTGLNALVEMVSLAGAGLGGGTLLRVAKGNDAVPAGLLTRSEARLHTEATVHRVGREDSTWQVTGEGFAPVTADVVVLAAPLELSSIELVGAPAPPPLTFLTLHVTFISGVLRPRTFGMTQHVPAFVLTTGLAGDLLSIEHVANGPSGRLYKVFSREALSDDWLQRHFHADDVTPMRWLAYPRLEPTTAWAEFRLAPGLYYTSAMEHAVSTMETQAIAGVATANLAVSDRGAPA